MTAARRESGRFFEEVRQGRLAIHILVDLSRRFSELAVFYARPYIRVRHIDEPA
jgi:hypothetical protein